MPASVRLIFSLHNHQPVGNFDGVFEAAERDSYAPFLDLIEDYPEIPVALHTSGPLLEWLVDRRPAYVERLRRLVAAGRVEVMGGGFYEPILTMIPHRDRVGQVRAYSDYLREVLGQPVRGAWLAERVWEQSLVTALAEAGIEYTVLDDFHFARAGEAGDHLFGYYLTEDQGRLLKVFPNSERMRYLTPWEEPHAAYEYLRGLAESRPGAIVVCADDGEKFGGWPGTYDHVYARGWFRRFFDMVRANRDWLEPTTFSRVVDTTVPLGKVYLPDASYREMTEWVLPPRQLAAFERDVKRAKEEAGAGSLLPYVRAGGSWRNFKAKYPESDEMYARMLGLSQRLAAIEARGSADSAQLVNARRELYRGQCNCAYWHGAFGGLYLPHLRNAVHGRLIACHEALDQAEGKTGPRASVEVGDYNLDARQEVKLENDRLIAWVRPAQGGHVYGLDVRAAGVNVLATLDRRPESYHGTIADAASHEQNQGPTDGPSNLHDRVILKQEGLDRLLVYDRHPRKALVDHFYAEDVTLGDVVACRAVERGDFAMGTYLAKVVREVGRAGVVMERTGLADGHALHLTKRLTIAAGQPELVVEYVLEDLPIDRPLLFAVEINVAAMAGHADDRYYVDEDGQRLGMLDATLEFGSSRSIGLVDEWLDLRVGLDWSEPAGLWCYPIATASQSEGGFEAIYQQSTVMPRWTIRADASRRWSVRIRWRLDLSAIAPVQQGREASILRDRSEDRRVPVAQW